MKARYHYPHFASITLSNYPCQIAARGIQDEKLKEIFEPFFTSKAEDMGMGLAIARTIVEARKGQKSARNRDHGGATFRIKLPTSDVIYGLRNVFCPLR
jgi:nitrogen-specific signal transduction histidine kinase